MLFNTSAFRKYSKIISYKKLNSQSFLYKKIFKITSNTPSLILNFKSKIEVNILKSY